MNLRSSNVRFVLAALLLLAGTLCGELARGLVSQVVAPALLVLGVVGLSYLSLTSNQPDEGAESTKRIASSR